MNFLDRLNLILTEKTNGSKSEFARKIGIHVSTISIWDDEHLPKGDILKRIHNEFNIDINWLLTGFAETGINIDRKEIEYNLKENEVLNVHSPGLGEQYGPDPLIHAITTLKKIFDSKSPVLIQAITANLAAFELSVKREGQLVSQAREIDNLRKECEELKRRITALEEDRKKEISRSSFTEESTESKAA